jgi:hypothetical protein
LGGMEPGRQRIGCAGKRRVKHRVGIKLAAAKATFAEKYGAMPEELRELIRKMRPQFDETREEAIAECPACSFQCVAAGVVTTDVDADVEETAWLIRGPGWNSRH